MSYALTQKGQVTLPKRVRDQLGVAPGEEVTFRLNDQGEMVVEKAGRTEPVERFAKWRGFFGPGLSTDEVMALTRGED
ncbi:MAG: AbrB/MazE/SpoVT family DNA-binding domain-containing protein [Terricaulis sp.]